MRGKSVAVRRRIKTICTIIHWYKLRTRVEHVVIYTAPVNTNHDTRPSSAGLDLPDGEQH